MLWNNVFLASSGRYLPPLQPGGTATAFASYACADEQDTAVGLAAQSALEALSRHPCQATLEWIIYASIFTDEQHYTPAAYLQHMVNAPEATAFKLDCASNGGTLALATATALLASSPRSDSTALVAAGTVIDPTLNRLTPMSGSILSDGGVAVVLARGEGFARIVATTHGAAPELEVFTRRGVTVDRTGHRHYELADQSSLLDHVDLQRKKSSQAALQLLDETGLSSKDIQFVAVPGFPPALVEFTITEPLGFSFEHTTWDFIRTVGHAGPCDQLLGLDHLLRSGSLTPGDRVLLAGAGAGFTWTYVLVEMLDPPAPYVETISASEARLW